MKFQSYDQDTRMSLDKLIRNTSPEPFHHIHIQNWKLCQVSHAVSKI